MTVQKRISVLITALIFALFNAGLCFAQQNLTLAAPLASGKMKVLEPNMILSSKIRQQKPLFKGKISTFANKPVQLGDKTTAPLGSIAKIAFKPLNQYAGRLNKRAKIGKTILTRPVVLDEAIEFDDSFVMRKSTSVIVLDPAEMKRISPTYNSFLSGRAAKKISVNALDAESRKGLADLMKNINALDPKNPVRLEAAKGEQAVLDAIIEGKGKLTIEDTIVVPKMIPRPVKGVTMYPGFKNGTLNFKSLKPVTLPVLKELNRVPKKMILKPVTNFKMQQVTMAPKNPDIPEFNTSGKHYFTAEFLAGFTKGHSWQWERKWTYDSGFFRVTIGGGYGFGLRVPVRARGELSPTNIYNYDRRDKEINAHGKIMVETLDADLNYYKRTGLQNSKLFRGNEVVLEYQLGFGYKLRALWKDLAKKKFSGIGLNYSQNARPPWGATCSNCGFHIPIPPEITQTTLDFSVMTGFVQTGFHVNGTGKAFFRFTPVFNNTPSSTINLMFDNNRYKSFNIRLLPLSPPSGKDQITQKFGFSLNNLVYRMGMSITPEVRVGVKAGYKSFSRTFTTQWIQLNMFKLRMGTVQLYTHEGTRQDYTFNEGIKIFKKISGKKRDPKKMKRAPKLKIN